MKHTTRILAMLLALVLCLGLSVTAFAAEGNSITVKNTVEGQTYKLYKMLDLSVSDDQTAYSYTVNTAWVDFFKETGKGYDYVGITDGFVTWKDSASIEAFAKDAEAFAKSKPLTEIAKKDTTEQDTNVVFENLEPGYYLVTSTLGTKATVGTTPSTPNPEIKEKNGVPTNVKKVQEDSDNSWGTVNDADIGQIVNFQSTITAQAGAENYVFHDKMSQGLSFNAESVVVKNGNTKLVVDKDYTLKTTGLADGYTFEVAFQQTFCDKLNPGEQIVISYSATLNEKAVIAGVGNPNTSHLTYGEEGKFSTTPSKTITYTWQFDVLKYGNSKKDNVLKDAQFVLLNNDESKVAKFTGAKFSSWIDVPGEGAAWDPASVLTTDANGKIHVEGLDADTYKLREIKAPDGYNKLSQDEQFTITATKADNGLTMTPVELTVDVNNQSGALLPSTGGMGTTIFYVLGGILAVGAAVLLVTKKRMERI